MTSAAAAQNVVVNRSVRDLTVPADRLPEGCVLSPAPVERLEGNRMRGGLWGGYPANPWIGTDLRLLSSTRQIVDGMPLMPDGPPLDQKAASRFELQLADGVEEGYAAFYKTAGSSLVAVFALRYKPTEPRVDPFHTPFHTTRAPRPNRIEVGPLAVVVSGDGGECSRAVETYVRSLGK